MASVEAIDDAEDIVAGWLKGKGRENLSTDTADVADGVLSHASTVGLGYTVKGEPLRQEKRVFTREDEILRKNIVSAKRKRRDLSKEQKKLQRADDKDDDEERFLMKSSADKDLEVSRTAIGSKKVKSDSKKNGNASSSSNSSSCSIEKKVQSVPSSTVDNCLSFSRGDNNMGQSTINDSKSDDRNLCINYSEYGQCRYGSSCRFSHACEPGSNKPVGGFVRQRTRKKTRSKQKNIRKDTRDEELKPQKYRPLTAETKKKLARNEENGDYRDDVGVFKPFSESNPNPRKMQYKDEGIINMGTGGARMVDKNKRKKIEKGKGKNDTENSEDLGFFIDRG